MPGPPAPSSPPRRRLQCSLRLGRRTLTITYARKPASGRMQFTLRTVLLAILAVALGLSIWIAKRQSDEIQMLHSRLRAEYADFEIDDADRDKLQAMLAPTDQLGKWHLFVPKGKHFRLNVYSGVIPATGDLDPADPSYSAQNLAYADLQPGDHDFTLSLTRNLHELDNTVEFPKWLLLGRMERLQMMSEPSLKLQKTLNTFDYDLQQTHEETTQIAQPGQSVELLRARFFAHRDDEINDKSGPGDGILVWVSEVPSR
jgi:hypothetical protein